MIIHSKSPARVDLAGGTLDIWPLYLFHENSQTVNFAIRCFAHCWLKPRQDGAIEFVSRDLKLREKFPSLDALKKAKSFRLSLHARLTIEFAPATGFTLETDSGVPAGSGLGGSSALNIAICGTLARFLDLKLSPAKLIEVARNVEAQVLQIPAGEQDYCSAVFGGMQAIHLTPHGVQPEKIVVNADEFSSRSVLCYTGQSRNSGINNWEVFKARIDKKGGKEKVTRHFDRIAAIASDMRLALETKDWEQVASLLNQEWSARKKNHPGISTPKMEQLISVARRNGALAAKACGAGGGGCIFFFVKPELKAVVETQLKNAGAILLDSRMAPRGLTISKTA